MPLPSVIVGHRSAPSFEPLPPFFADLAEYWTADHGALDANGDPATAGTPVAAWHSRRGGLVLEQSTAASRPIWSAAGIGTQPSLSFDGADDLLEAVTPSGYEATDDLTLAMVIRTGSIIDTLQRIFTARSSTGRHWVCLNGSALRYIFRDSQSYSRSGPLAEPETPYIVVATYHAPTKEVTISINGVSYTGTAGSTVSGNPARMYVGGVVNSQTIEDCFTGRFGEVLRYPRVLTPAETTALEQWLAARYGITLA